jgi:hypothetical protein
MTWTSRSGTRGGASAGTSGNKDGKADGDKRDTQNQASAPRKRA